MTEDEMMLYRLAGWSFKVSGGEVFVSVPGRDITEDIDTTKLTKEMEYLEGFMIKLKTKLDNKSFSDRAPEDVVNKEIKKWNDCWDRYDTIDKTLKYLEKKNGL